MDFFQATSREIKEQLDNYAALENFLASKSADITKLKQLVAILDGTPEPDPTPAPTPEPTPEPEPEPIAVEAPEPMTKAAPTAIDYRKMFNV